MASMMKVIKPAPNAPQQGTSSTVFPFSAVCYEKRSISPLKTSDKVVVFGMADEGECEREMFVSVRWGKNDLAVPLYQLMPISSVSEATKEAVDDWHY